MRLAMCPECLRYLVVILLEDPREVTELWYLRGVYSCEIYQRSIRNSLSKSFAKYRRRRWITSLA